MEQEMDFLKSIGADSILYDCRLDLTILIYFLIQALYVGAISYMVLVLQQGVS